MPGTTDTIAASPNAYSFGLGAELFTIFDTGTSFTMIPNEYWIAFTDNLVLVNSLRTYNVESGIFIFDCAEKSSIPDLYFMFDSHWF